MAVKTQRALPAGGMVVAQKTGLAPLSRQPVA